VSRRGDPERIYQAQRAGLRSRIRDQWRQSDPRADELLNAWEYEASARGLKRGEPTYWDQGGSVDRGADWYHLS
jgi:hypothetical protein